MYMTVADVNHKRIVDKSNGDHICIMENKSANTLWLSVMEAIDNIKFINMMNANIEARTNGSFTVQRNIFTTRSPISNHYPFYQIRI